MKQTEKTECAHTISYMFKRMDRPACVLSMASSKKLAKKRIEGIFMRQYTKHSVKAIAMLVAIIVSATCFTTACQPTPESPIVVNKGSGEYEQIILATPAPELISKPYLASEWDETYELQGLTCYINPEIIMKTSESYPIYGVRQTNFEEDFARKMINNFLPDIVGIRDNTLTKEDYEDMLISAKRGMQMMLDNEVWWEPYEGQQEDIEYYSEMIKKTPTVTYEPVDTKSLEIEFPMNVQLENSDGSTAVITFKDQVVSYSKYRNSILQPESWVLSGHAYIGEPAGTTVDVKITEAEALLVAQGIIDELEIEGFGQAYATKARMLDTSMDREILASGWLITYARTSDQYVPIDFDYGAESVYINTMYIEEFAEDWALESVRVFVDENGVGQFYWQFPLEVTETINENVTLMPFEELQNSIKNTIKFSFSNMVELDPTLMRNSSEEPPFIKIHKMVLTNRVEQIKDDSVNRMLTPIWVMY